MGAAAAHTEVAAHRELAARTVAASGRDHSRELAQASVKGMGQGTAQELVDRVAPAHTAAPASRVVEEVGARVRMGPEPQAEHTGAQGRIHLALPAEGRAQERDRAQEPDRALERAQERDRAASAASARGPASRSSPRPSSPPRWQAQRAPKRTEHRVGLEASFLRSLYPGKGFPGSPSLTLEGRAHSLGHSVVGSRFRFRLELGPKLPSHQIVDRLLEGLVVVQHGIHFSHDGHVHGKFHA
jgi:hypothetical protein